VLQVKRKNKQYFKNSFWDSPWFLLFMVAVCGVCTGRKPYFRSINYYKINRTILNFSCNQTVFFLTCRRLFPKVIHFEVRMNAGEDLVEIRKITSAPQSGRRGAGATNLLPISLTHTATSSLRERRHDDQSNLMNQAESFSLPKTLFPINNLLYSETHIHPKIRLLLVGIPFNNIVGTMDAKLSGTA
jgi:hypothetical protein